MERLPFYGQVLVFCGLAVAVVLAAYTLWPGLGDTRKQIAELEERYAEMEREIHKGRAIEARLPEFEREIANLEQKLADIQQILPTARDTLELVGRAYEQAEVGYLELLTAQRTFSETNLAYLDAVAALWQSRLAIDGLLLDNSLGVE